MTFIKMELLYIKETNLGYYGNWNNVVHRSSDIGIFQVEMSLSVETCSLMAARNWESVYCKQWSVIVEGEYLQNTTKLQQYTKSANY